MTIELHRWKRVLRKMIEELDKRIEAYKEKTREKARLYREQNKEKLRLKFKEYREKNKEKIKQAQLKFREKNPERTKQWKQIWREKNPDYDKARYLRESKGIEIEQRKLQLDKKIEKKQKYEISGPKTSWSIEELNLMMNEYSQLGINIRTKLNNKCDSSIRNKAMHLGLNCKKEVRIINCSNAAKQRPLRDYTTYKFKYDFYNDKEKQQKIIDMYTKEKISINKIAEIYGVSCPQTIGNFLIKKSIRIIKGGVNCKIWSDEDILFLKKNYWKGDERFICTTLKTTWTAIHHKAERLGIKRHMTFCIGKPTKIELKVKDILDKHNVKYKYDQPVNVGKNRRFPDFRIGDLVIECDGTYWHKDKTRDIKRNKELINAGYILLHFSENTINKNIIKVEKCILKKLNELSLLKNQIGVNSPSGGD